jgi:hypothetical protein
MVICVRIPPRRNGDEGGRNATAFFSKFPEMRPSSVPALLVGLRREINLNDVRIKRESIKLADLSRHFQQRELADRNPRIAYSTKKAYAGYVEKWIEPRWGQYSLLEIRAGSRVVAEVAAPGSRTALQNTERDESVVQPCSSPRPL